MKQTLQLIVFTILLFLSNLSSYAQTCGNVLLQTQTDVNKFSCTSINGDLTIRSSLIDPITDLSKIYENGLQNGNVSGNVLVENCNSLLTLRGLHGIRTIGGRFTINNCPKLRNMGNIPYRLETVGTFFLFINLPDLVNISGLEQLTSVGQALAFQFECGLQDYTPLNSLKVCPWVEYFQTTMSSVNAPFSNLSSTGYVHLFNNKFSSFNGFSSLKDVVVTSSPSLSGAIRIVDNKNLSNISFNPNLNSAQVLTITGNSNLSACCFVSRPIGNNPSNMSISGNSAGCNSPSQIDAPPIVGACPANLTISTNSNDCFGMTNVASPQSFDNCDFDTYEVDIDLGDGTVFNDFPTSSGQLLTYTLPPSLNTITYTATDQNGNSASCSFNITVIDNTVPVLSNIPPSVTISCNDPFPSIPSPLATDNCDPNPMLTAGSSTSVGNCELGMPAEVQSYSWTATDASGNSLIESWTVTVISDFSFNLGGTVAACNGSSFLIDPGNIGNTYEWSTSATTQAISVSSSGTYAVTITTSNGCCYSDEIDVNFEDPPAAMATGATLNCGSNSVQIMGSSTTAGATYAWTGPGGFTSTMQNPMVSSTGTYTLTVSSPAGCTSTATASVVADNDVPEASAEGGTLNCTVSSVQLQGISSTSGVSFAWSGPGGFTSSMQNPQVSTDGTYSLTVTGSNGCSATADAEVIDDTEVPAINISDGVISCTNSEVDYSLDGNVSWSGPGSFSSTANSVILTTPGNYGVTVTGDNGCSNSAAFTISEDLSPPQVSAEGGVISCESLGDTLQASSTTAGATFTWSGPEGFVANVAAPYVVTLGTYTLTVTAPNGCTSSASVELVGGEDAPILEASGGIITCNNPTVNISVSASQSNLEYSWTGPNGFTSDAAMVEVSEPGTYTVIGTNSEGCSGTTMVEIIGNNQAPELVISAPNINCLDGLSLFMVESSSAIASYDWAGPENFTSMEANPGVEFPGVYYLTVIGENGCEGRDSFDLQSDVESPDASAMGGTITCTENTITIMGSSTTADVSYLWEGPNGFVSAEQNPLVSLTGKYILNVIAPNGCAAIDSAFVEGDPDLPTISAVGGVINCINEQVTLMGATESENVTVQWLGPNGFFSSNPTPQVDIPGDYTFSVTSASNCEVISIVEVTLDNRIPDLLLSFGAINCEAGTGRFSASTNALSGSFSWTGPDGFTSSELNATYSQAGTYTLTIVDNNGCSAQGIINVENEVGFETNLIITGNDAMLEITGGTPPFSVVFNNSIESNTATDLNNGEHFVTIIDGLGCQEVINFTINSTSTNEIAEALGIKLYPNPVDQQLKVEWNEQKVDFSEVFILDSKGRLLRTVNVSGGTSVLEDLDHFSSGIYFLKLKGDGGSVTRKFMKL